MVAPISESNSIVTNDCIALLRARNASGYRHVYEHHAEERFDGRRAHTFIAKIRVKGKLIRLKGSSPNARECAKRVVQWYIQHYGADKWREQIIKRQTEAAPLPRAKPGRYIQDAGEPFEVRQNAEDGGWNLWVWEFGARVPVRERLRKRSGKWRCLTPNESMRRKSNGKPLGRMRLFQSRAMAERFVAVWLALRWGVFGESANTRA